MASDIWLVFPVVDIWTNQSEVSNDLTRITNICLIRWNLSCFSSITTTPPTRSIYMVETVLIINRVKVLFSTSQNHFRKKLFAYLSPIKHINKPSRSILQKSSAKYPGSIMELFNILANRYLAFLWDYQEDCTYSVHFICPDAEIESLVWSSRDTNINSLERIRSFCCEFRNLWNLFDKLWDHETATLIPRHHQRKAMVSG